jgi:hypothetical protein
MDLTTMPSALLSQILRTQDLRQKQVAAGHRGRSAKKSTTTLPLIFNHGHLFVELEEHLWLFDTGAPTSFGAAERLLIAGEQFSLSSSYFGLTASTLSQYVGFECSGLLGADVLGRFDHILDTTGGRLAVSTAELSHDGQRVHLDEFMGIPIVTTSVPSRK